MAVSVATNAKHLNHAVHTMLLLLLLTTSTRSHLSPSTLPQRKGRIQQPSSANCSRPLTLPREVQSGPLGKPQFGSSLLLVAALPLLPLLLLPLPLLPLPPLPVAALLLVAAFVLVVTRSHLSPASFPQRMGRRQQPSGSANCSSPFAPRPRETQSGPSGKPQLFTRREG
jgi:hypothetical protein